MVAELDKSKSKSDSLLSQMLPLSTSKSLMEGKPVEPEYFESATVFFLDVIRFTTICAKVHPLHTVALLNDIYKMFDDFIERYDAYKVESIGIF